MTAVRYKYASLEDFLNSWPLSVDGVLDDGWGASFSVKGIETLAAVLFADITYFSGRTLDLTPTETLIFVNNFFAWITAEALQDRPGIVDKYIGDEIMVIFSQDFGSEDPFLDAVRTARNIAENDALSYCPRIGIAAGPVVIGYVGTPIKYNASVFGRTVTLAKRCATVRPKASGSSTIIFPADLWRGRSLSEVLPLRKFKYHDGTVQERPLGWEEFAPRTVELKNVPKMDVVEIGKEGRHLPSLSAEDRARKSLGVLKEAGRYWPRGLPKPGS